MSTKLYWIDLNRFDQKLNKSPFLEICECLTKVGFHVSLLTGFRKRKYIPPDGDFQIIYFRSIHLAGMFRYSLIMNIFFWLLWRIRREDLVLVQPGALMLACLLKWVKRCKVHLDVRTVPVEIHRFRDRLDRWLFWDLPIKRFARYADGFSFITPALKNTVEKEFKVRFHHAVIWTSGVNSRRFSQAAITAGEKSDGRFRLLYAGVITKNRGLDNVLSALCKLKKEYKTRLTFYLVGDGAFRKALETMTDDLEIREMVRFTGYVPYEKMPEMLRKADLFICPLPNRPEWNVSSPIKIFEYMMFAKPIILTPIPAHQQIANGLDFVVWTRGDAADCLAEAIRFALEHYPALQEAAKQAPDFVRDHYDWQVQGGKLARYLKSILR